MELRPNAGHGLLILEVSRSHTTTHQSVGLIWTGDQPVAETSTWQHTTITTDKHPCPPGRIRTHDLSRRAAVDLRLRPVGDNPIAVNKCIITLYYYIILYYIILYYIIILQVSRYKATPCMARDTDVWPACSSANDKFLSYLGETAEGRDVICH